MNIKELPLVKLIDDKYREWKPNSNILIGAAMGTGKTTFILDVLGKYAKENNKQILYLSNRTELKKEIDKNIKENKLHGVIISITYQTLEHILLNRGDNKEQNEIRKIFYDDIDYIVCDECHYFLTDSWTKKTDVSYEYIINHQKAINLFMTATYFNIFDVLNVDLKKLNKMIIEYYIDFDFSYISNIIFYSQQEYVNNLINSLPAEEKLIYFCRKLDIALELHQQYVENSSFVCSKVNKNYKKFRTENPIEDNKLTNQLTFTSTTWDNGINIIDSDVKHIVIDINDLVSFIQCLGRRRLINKDDKIILHVRNWTKEELTQFNNPNFAQRNLNDEFIKNEKEYLEKLKAGEIRHGECMYNDILTKEITLNKLMDKDIRVQINRYHEATATGMNFAKYINKVLKCKNIKRVDYKEEIQQKQISEFVIYLESIVGIKLYREQQQELCNKIISEIPGVKGKNRIRSKKLNPSMLEKILCDDLKLNYAISSKQESNRKNHGKRYIVISKI